MCRALHHHQQDGDEEGEEEWGEGEEQVGEGREEVGDTSGACLIAVLTDLPRLRGSTGYTTTNLHTTLSLP